jgi:integrase
MANPTGIAPRHSRKCPKFDNRDARCRCTPTWSAWVLDSDGKKIRRAFKTQAAARTWRGDSVSARKQRQQSTSTLTVAEAAEEWLQGCEAGTVLSRNRRPYKASAIRGYRRDFKSRINPELGTLPLDAVTHDQVQDLVDGLIGSGLSGSSVRNAHTALAALYRRYRRQVAVDPTSDLDLPASDGVRDRVAEPEELQKLLAALPDDLRPLFATAGYAGLRLGELRALRAENVDFDLGCIHVEHGWDPYTGEILPKSKAGVRPVPLVSLLRAELKAHLERTGRTGRDFLFGKHADKRFADSWTRVRAKKAWDTAKLAHIGYHELRHSFGSYLDAVGISEVRHDFYMGHSNHSMHARYTHQLRDQLAADAATLDAYLVAASTGKVVQMRRATAESRRALSRHAEVGG